MVSKNTDFWLNEAELKTPKHDEMVLWAFSNYKNVIDELNLDRKFRKWNNDCGEPIIKKKSVIEYPLKGYNGFTLGFLDLVIETRLENGEFIRDNSDCASPYNIDLICFEIKPEVKSIGDVIRQFQYYKSHLFPSVRLVLVTKTTGLKELFESQGFYVYEYKEVDNGKSY